MERRSRRCKVSIRRSRINPWLSRHSRRTTRTDRCTPTDPVNLDFRKKSQRRYTTTRKTKTTRPRPRTGPSAQNPPDRRKTPNDMNVAKSRLGCWGSRDPSAMRRSRKRRLARCGSAIGVSSTCRWNPHTSRTPYVPRSPRLLVHDARYSHSVSGSCRKDAR
jgi:hypothetical protein